MRKKTLLWVILVVLLTFGGIYAYQSRETEPPGYQEGKLLKGDSSAKRTKTGAETNFYNFVNKEWLEETEIPGDYPMYGISSEVSLAVHENLANDVMDLYLGYQESNLPGMSEFLDFYEVAFDFDRREAEGVEPIKPYLKEIESLSSLKDFSSQIEELILKGYPLPFYFLVGINPENTDQKMLELHAPDLILPDVAYYEDETEKTELLDIYSESAVELLIKIGYSQKDAEHLVKEALAYDELMLPYQMTSEEKSDIRNGINPRSGKEISAYTEVLNLADLAQELVGKNYGQVNVYNLDYFENLDTLLTEENFPKMKAWMQVRLAVGVAPYLDEDSRVLAGQLDLALTGVEELQYKEDVAYGEILDYFSPTLSTYYGQKYFGKEAKDQVTEMIQTIVEVYQDRLQANTWLSNETKKKAIEKLEKMTYFVGYPEEVDPIVELYQVDPEVSYLDNVWQMDEAVIKRQFEEFREPVDKTAWGAASYEVNAYYDPYQNAIIFPAGILTDPFFSLDQTPAQNYGAIGAVIGHEITHAFDSNGALFDAKGNMKNWWTQADQEAFEEKTEAMVEHFDGVPIYGGKVNGKLTVTENTADAGGLSSALEALQRVDKNPDLKEFFESYAISWRNLIRPEFAKLLLLDEHAPDELRVNLQVNLLDEFYETYDVREGDSMYLPEDKRIKIW